MHYDTFTQTYNFKVVQMIIFILLLLFVNCDAKGRYECGPHGNFEYCIEGFPGCVVGCHCFPGYYFDTDTKICEPNIKLTQDFRRHYAMGTGPPPGASDAPTSPPPTTAHALEAHVDEIANDTGDLSDWLYNQFFKTIENQVINKTDDDELLKGTRRSGGAAKRKSKKKHGNKRKNSKKSTNRGLRRKLLRISEDDSMFDSSSDSESRSREDSGTWESWEEAADSGHHSGGDDKDHGHRKIVVYSKQPKAPLPSFIFLPNVETPFYPPIGLPVPPMPMYPMIPVPPIIPPPVYTNISTGNETTTTTQKTTAVTDNDESRKLPPSTVAETVKTTSEGTTSNLVEDSTDPGLRKVLRSPGRKKLLQRLKGRNNQQQIIKRMGTMGGRLRKSKNNHFIDQLQDPTMLVSDNLFQEPIIEETRDPERDDGVPYEDDVDFKYLTQLIHRVDANQSTSLPTVQFIPNKTSSIKDIRARAMYEKFKKPRITPGRLQDGIPTRRRFEDCSSKPDDTYYSSLGRQIATLIRGINPDVVSEVNIDIDRMNSKTEPFLNENSFAPRSYWERFVRSPLRTDLGHFSRYEDLKESNEKLFDLENKAEVAASSSPVLTLQELENVISAMNKVQKQIQNRQFKEDNHKLSKGSLNVSLLPRYSSRPTKVPKKLTNDIIMNTFLNVDNGKVIDKKGVLSRNSRRNNPKTMHAKADGIQSNLTYDNQLFNKHKLTELFFNAPRDKFRLTSTPVALKPHVKSTRPPNPNYQPSPRKFNRSNVNNNYSNNKNNLSNLRTEARKPYAYYIKPKPASYFFNEFDFFVKKKK